MRGLTGKCKRHLFDLLQISRVGLTVFAVTLSRFKHCDFDVNRLLRRAADIFTTAT
jgi:hypothetical protein